MLITYHHASIFDQNQMLSVSDRSQDVSSRIYSTKDVFGLIYNYMEQVSQCFQRNNMGVGVWVCLYNISMCIKNRRGIRSEKEVEVERERERAQPSMIGTQMYDMNHFKLTIECKKNQQSMIKRLNQS